MSDNHSQSDVPSLDEDLVAYLDGELEDPASRRLEERLANDESARERLRALATSWNLLDHLPRAALDEAFTRTTVELLVAEARQEIAAEQAALPLRKRRRWIAAAVAGLAAAMIGFIAVFVAWPNENERLLRDLAVIKNLEQYDVLPPSNGIEFLRQLENAELFIADMAAEVPSESRSVPEEGVVITPEVLAARRSEVEALPPEKRDQLRRLYERFRARPASEQERLRELDAILSSDPDEPRLRAVLDSYHNWLTTLTPLDRAKLLEMASNDALEEIRRIKKDELGGFARSVRFGQGPLTDSDVDTIEHWLENKAWQEKDEILANATERQREWFEKLPEDRKKRLLVHLTREPGPPKPPTLTDEEWSDLLERIPTVKALFATRGKGKADALLTQMTKDAKEIIKQEVGQATSSKEQQKLLFHWYFRAQFARLIAGGGVSPQELQRFLNEEVSEDERRKLAQLPPDRFRKELRFKYFREKEMPPGRWGQGRGRGDRRHREDDHDRFKVKMRHGPSSEFDRDRDDRGDDEDRHRSRDPDRNESDQ
jgi:hypothetical protein